MSSGKREVKVVLLGDSGVGKTSLVLRFVTDSFRLRSEPNIGASFMAKALQCGGKDYLFQIWDTAGQEKYGMLARKYHSLYLIIVKYPQVVHGIQPCIIGMLLLQSWCMTLRGLNLLKY